jgi:hypothetical protein
MAFDTLRRSLPSEGHLRAAGILKLTRALRGPVCRASVRRPAVALHALSTSASVSNGDPPTSIELLFSRIGRVEFSSSAKTKAAGEFLISPIGNKLQRRHSDRKE